MNERDGRMKEENRKRMKEWITEREEMKEWIIYIYIYRERERERERELIREKRGKNGLEKIEMG